MRFFIVFVFLFPAALIAQVANPGITTNYDSLENDKVKIGGYIDTYYGYDFNEPEFSDRPYFVSSARHNEININLAYIEVQYTNDKVRGRLVPGFGTYVNANYANEKGSLKNLLEANIGVRLSKKKEIWLDAGVIGSPYTNETAISKDHLMYTRSLASEYVPYYLTGVKLSVPIGDKIKAYGYVLNGWQVISDVNNPLSIGTQIEYRPTNNVLINWDTYIGDESSALNPTYRTRYFTDIYFVYNSPKKFSMTSCAYLGVQDTEDSVGIKKSAIWWQANVIVDFKLAEKSTISARMEYFNDEESVQIVPITGLKGFEVFSASIGFNYKIVSKAIFRLEARSFYSNRDMYVDTNGAFSQWSNLLITSLAVWF